MNKMNKIKRSIKLTACVVAMILLSALITAAVSAKFYDVTDYREAIETLNSVGVITGMTETQFSPDNNVTRWQMALLMTKLLTAEVDNTQWASSAGNIIFEDVVNNIRHYGGSIAFAVNQNIIIGRSETVFAPEDGITLQEAVTIMVRSLGYPRQQYDAGYPDSYIEKANELGLFDGLLNVGATDVITRGETAQLLYNVFRAPKRIGNTIAEDVFRYSDSTIVLTATQQLRINPRVKPAASGKLVFCELNPDGTIDTTTAVSLNASDFGFANPDEYLGKSFRVTSVMNYQNILSIEECETETLTQNTISRALSVFSPTGDYIKLDNVTYEVVPRYSYDLEDDTPVSKEIIIYGAGDIYDSVSVLSASDIYGTTAYYTLTTYDDNGDGYPDRALYRPYSFALYTKSGNDIKLEGDLTHNLKANAVDITGTNATTGNYVLYSYIPDASAVDILKTMPVVSGTVVSYTADTITLKANTSTTSSEYDLGDAMLPGAYPSAVKNKLAANPGVSYIGNTVKYAVDGKKVLMLDITDLPGGGTQDRYISRTNCAVVREVYTANFQNYGYISLEVNLMDSLNTSSIIKVRYINGNQLITVNALPVQKGDIVEYSVYSLGAVAADNLYSIVNISSKPYGTSGTSNAYTYYLGATSGYIGIGYKASAGQAALTYDSLLPLSTDTKVMYYNGIYFENLTDYIAANANYEQNIQKNCSIYASYGPTGNTVKFVYIRPKYAALSGGDITDPQAYSRILYLSQQSIDNKYPSNGVVYYPEAFDLISNKYVTAEFTGAELSNIMPQWRGYYKAVPHQLDNARSRITEHNPLAGDVSNTNIIYSSATISNLSVTGNVYKMQIGDKIYTTSDFSIYRFDANLKIEPVDINTVIFMGVGMSADVFMVPSNALGSTTRIAAIIY